jgi:hypothetical protein
MQAQLLMRTNLNRSLHRNAFMRQIANNAYIRLVESDVGQGTESVPMSSPRFSRRRYC